MKCVFQLKNRYQKSPILRYFWLPLDKNLN